MLDAFVAVDLEMTGVDPVRDRILEAGAVRISGGKEEEIFQSFANPHREIPETVRTLTGISSDMVQGAPEDIDVLKALDAFAGNLPFVGHSILCDYRFLKQCAVNHKYHYIKYAVDTLKIARKCLPDLPSRKLEDLCIYYGICSGQEHRAVSDARMTAQLFRRLQEEFETVYPELFSPVLLQYRAKRQTPLTPAQKRDLNHLLSYHKIIPDTDIDSLTRSEASRMIDRILSRFGRPERQERAYEKI